MFKCQRSKVKVPKKRAYHKEFSCEISIYQVLALTNQMLLTSFNFQKVGQTPWSRSLGKKCLFPWKGSVTRNTLMKYQCSSTHNLNVISKVKVFLKNISNSKVKVTGSELLVSSERS